MEVHPAADVWPMLPPDELQALADDIKAHGLIHPVVLTPAGEVLDGRNRLAACKLAGIKPAFTTYDGDLTDYVIGSNSKRRHMTTGARAMATARNLDAAGKRTDGRWQRGTLTAITDSGNSGWQQRMTEAGLVLDVLPELVPQVIEGALTLSAAHQQAVDKRDEATKVEARMSRLTIDAPDLALMVSEDRLTLPGAEGELRERRKAHAKIGTDGERAAEAIGESISNALAIIGALQAGFEIDAVKAISHLTTAADGLAEFIEAER